MQPRIHVITLSVSDLGRALDFYRGRGFVPVADEVLELVLPQA